MGHLQIVPTRLHRVHGPLKAVSLVVVRHRAEWVASLHARHQSPAGRDGNPWQLIDRYGEDGPAVSTHDDAAALIHYMAGARRLPGLE